MKRYFLVMQKLVQIISFMFFALSFASCKSKTTFSIVSYNAQTFFDLVEDGREFKEFKKAGWKEVDYNMRLKRLLHAVKLCTNQLQKGQDVPDVLVLQEIESAKVLTDLCKRIKEVDAFKEFVFVPIEDGGAFSTAILSKHKVLGAKAHKVYKDGMPLRPIIEAEICFELNGKDCMLSLFAVHWKSKREGGEDVRKMQEELLYNRMQECKKRADFVLSCGDFNQNDSEFAQMQEFQNAWQLHRAHAKEAEGSSYLDGEYTEIDGSYCYKGRWEKIDHFFYIENNAQSAKLCAIQFALAKDAPLVRDGESVRYNAYTKQGYSDHLPIGLLLGTTQ